MVISQVNQACGYFHENEFVPFCSPGCLLREYEKLKKQGGATAKKVYFVDYPGRQFIPSDSTYFLLTEHIATVMNSGALCFKSENSAQSHKKYSDEIITDWNGYQLLRGTPDRIVNITVTPEGMEPEVVVLNKNEIIEWVFQSKDRHTDEVFQLKGYEELGDIILPGGGEPVKLRMRADKPGAGFPFIRVKDKTPVGMVKVTGAHTSDEEAT
jgi:hypothetical protein